MFFEHGLHAARTKLRSISLHALFIGSAHFVHEVLQVGHGAVMGRFCVSQQHNVDLLPNIFSLFCPIARDENASSAVVQHCNEKNIIVLKFMNVLLFHCLRQTARVITCTASVLCHWKQGCSNTVEETKVVVNVFDIHKTFFSASPSLEVLEYKTNQRGR